MKEIKYDRKSFESNAAKINVSKMLISHLNKAKNYNEQIEILYLACYYCLRLAYQQNSSKVSRNLRILFIFFCFVVILKSSIYFCCFFTLEKQSTKFLYNHCFYHTFLCVVDMYKRFFEHFSSLFTVS